MRYIILLIITVVAGIACTNEDNQPTPLIKEMQFGVLPDVTITSENQLIDSLTYPGEPVTVEVNAIPFEDVTVENGEVLIDFIYTRISPETGREEVYTETASYSTFTSLPTEVTLSAEVINDLFGFSFEGLRVGDTFVVRPSFDLTNGLDNVDTWSGDLCREAAYEANCDVVIPYSCKSDLGVEGVTYLADVTVLTACCELPTGMVEEDYPTTITQTGPTEYRVASLFGGWLNGFSIGDEPITIVDNCNTFTLADANSALSYTGAGSGVEIDGETGVITIRWNNAGNSLSGVTVYTPQ